MKARLQKVTPEWAAKILATQNTKNRRINPKWVKLLASEITRGAFITTHEGIAFDEDGILLDGQQRLSAVVLANKPIEIMVTTDIPRWHKIGEAKVNTFEIIGTQTTRRTGAMLQMAGFVNANRVAAISRSMIVAASKCQLKTSTAQIHAGIAAAKGSAEAVAAMYVSSALFKPSAPVLAAVAFYHTLHISRAEHFMHDLINISGEDNSPTRHLAMWCVNHNITGGDGQKTAFKAAANSIQSFHENSPVKKLVPSSSAEEWLLSLNPSLTANLAKILSH